MERTAVEQRSVAERVAEEHKLGVTPSDQPGKGRVGSLENPEVYDDVPGHVIPILEREFDDFDTESAKFMRGDMLDQFIGFRLKQGVYGQRQADVQMIRVKLPARRHHAGAGGGVCGSESSAGRRWARDASRRAEHRDPPHPPSRKDAADHPPDQRLRPLLPRGLREHDPERHRRPWAGITEGELFDITPYAMAYVAATSCATRVTQLDAAEGEDGVHRDRRRDVAITGIHDIGFIPRLRDGVRGVEIRVGRRHLDHAASRTDAVRVHRAGRRATT